MNRKETLEQAISTVCSDREGQYGSPENNFEIIKDLWQTYLSAVIEKKDGFIDAVDVAMMMSLLKIARIATGKHKDDNYIDLAGYAACAAELSGIVSGDIESDTKTVAELKVQLAREKEINSMCRENIADLQDQITDLQDQLAESIKENAELLLLL